MSNYGFITQFFYKYKCTDSPRTRQGNPVLITRLQQAHTSLNKQDLLFAGPAPANPKQPYCPQFVYQSGLTPAPALQESNAAAYLLLKEEQWVVFKRNSTGMTPRERGIKTERLFDPLLLGIPNKSHSEHSRKRPHLSRISCSQRCAAAVFHSSVSKAGKQMAKGTLRIYILLCKASRNGAVLQPKTTSDRPSGHFERLCTQSQTAHLTLAVGWLHPEQNTEWIYQHPTAVVMANAPDQAQGGFSCTAAVQTSVCRNVLGACVSSETA